MTYRNVHDRQEEIRRMTDQVTRRNIFIGAAASLICAPAIVRAASLMPVRGLPLQFLNLEFLNPLGQFYRSNFYHNLDNDLRAGRAMTTVINNGKIISVAEAHRMVARARAEGWLPPYSPTIQVAHALEGVSAKYIAELIVVHGPALRKAQEKISAHVFELLGLKLGSHNDAPLVPDVPSRAKPMTAARAKLTGVR